MANAPGKHHRKGLTLPNIIEMFPNDKAAKKWFAEVRWPDGITCAHCESDNVQTGAKHPTMPYHCRSCRKYFSVRTGTVMADSKIGFQKWALAIFLMNTSLKGVSSMKLRRDVGLTQKSAWHMAHRIRQTWEKGTGLNGNAVEVDEAFFGGKESNKHPDNKLHAGRGTVGKTAVAGAKDRETGQIAAEVVPDTKADTLQGFAKQHVEKGGTMYSDDAVAYADFDHVAKHESVKHSIGEYVRGMAHVNGMESFWSMMKRGFHGTYHRMSPKHLQRYVSEFAGRHNIRDRDTIDQMIATAAGLVGKRLQYRELIG